MNSPLYLNRRDGGLLVEMIVAISILATTLLPLAFAFGLEQKMCQSYYNRAVAMEIADGEMETLLAGEWRSWKKGTQPYSTRAEAAKNLPQGKFELTLQGKNIRLEWIPNAQGKGGRITREATLR